jgi:FHA domain/Zinc-ribbon containing domain
LRFPKRYPRFGGLEPFVIIRIIFGGETDTVHAGTLAGAGCFRCDSCGYAVALHELDEVPPCPHCEGRDFRRSSLFAELSLAEPNGTMDEQAPDWVAEAREALVSDGDYLAYDDGERVRVIALQEGWTRIGRSLAAHVRFDDPTVSRRHALLHCQDESVRILDDRSLNGVFVNGARVDMRELRDGDQVSVGRFSLHIIRLGAGAAKAPAEAEVERDQVAIG